MLSYYETLLGDYRYLTRYIKVIEKITPDEIMLVAQKYLRKKNRTVATLVSSRTLSEQSGQPSGSKMEK
jgi:predicted Zn-dependent peptidase